jgi:ribonuclease Z
MIFELTVLGSSSALPTSTKFPSAHVLNAHGRFFLIDCGEGTQIQLRRSKIGFAGINHIFISHMHGDHVFGLFGILSTFQLQKRQKSIHIFGPPGIDELIGFFRTNFGADLPYDINLTILKKRQPHVLIDDRQLEVHAFPLKHRVPAFGYLFREKSRPLNIRKEVLGKYKPGIVQIQRIKAGEDLILEDGNRIPNAEITQPPYRRRSYAYCSDTMYYKKNIDLLRGVDLLYHEATFKKTDVKLAKLTGHSTTAQAAEFASKAGVGKLLIGHFSSRYKNMQELVEEARLIFPDTEIATELSKFSVLPVRTKERSG